MSIWIAIGIVILVIIVAVIVVFFALFKDMEKIFDDQYGGVDQMLAEALREHDIKRWGVNVGVIPPQEAKNGLKTLKFDYDLIDNIEFDDVDTSDYPDFVDAYIANANYDGEEMTEYQLDRLNEDKSFVYEKLMEHLY